jgi:hypothetical protein
LLPEQLLPEQLLPEQLLPEQLLPEQAFPEQLLPEQLLPEQLLPEQLLPEQKLPEANCMSPLNSPLVTFPAGFDGSASHCSLLRLFLKDGSCQAFAISSGESCIFAFALDATPNPARPARRNKSLRRRFIKTSTKCYAIFITIPSRHYKIKRKEHC